MTTEWKVGDEVRTSELVPATKIIKITPKGRIVTADGRQFNPDGSFRGRGWDRLRPHTPEDDAQIDRERRAVELNDAMRSHELLVENLRRSLGRGFRRYTPDAAELAKVERFLTVVKAWEDSEGDVK